MNNIYKSIATKRLTEIVGIEWLKSNISNLGISWSKDNDNIVVDFFLISKLETEEQIISNNSKKTYPDGTIRFRINQKSNNITTTFDTLSRYVA